jgi:hypothetical protein
MATNDSRAWAIQKSARQGSVPFATFGGIERATIDATTFHLNNHRN